MKGHTNDNTSTQWDYIAQVITKSLKYAYFTEDTNYTTIPIKFYPPPFRDQRHTDQPAVQRL